MLIFRNAEGGFCVDVCGGGAANTPGEMYSTILGYDEDNIRMKPDRWDQDFINHHGRNMNKSANAIAKLLKMLGEL